LFAPSATEPQVAFELRVRPAPGVAQIVFVVDGQTVDFHNGPERWHHLRWPGEAQRRGASLRVVGQGVDETIVQEGEWGLFRLLERGSVSFDQGARFFSVRFRLRTQRDVVIDVRPARVDNPFVGEGGLLEAFRGDGVAPPRAIAKGARRCAEPSNEGRGGRS
jgi:type VI secretion system protein ImpL